MFLLKRLGDSQVDPNVYLIRSEAYSKNGDSLLDVELDLRLAGSVSSPTERGTTA